jgi:ADP-heptose:LPS heptosyltransferase
VRAEDVAALRECRDIIDLTAHLTDFAESAALVSCLDLVIPVDASVAHLAGALGRRTWVLLPVRARLSLAARSSGQPVVSERAPVQAGCTPRLR